MSIARCFSKEKSLRILYISYIVSCVIVCMFYKGENATLSLFFVHVPVCVQQRERERAYTLESAGGQWFVFLFIRFECLLKVSYLSLPAIVSRVFLLQRSTSPQSGMHAVTKDRREKRSRWQHRRLPWPFQYLKPTVLATWCCFPL